MKARIEDIVRLWALGSGLWTLQARHNRQERKGFGKAAKNNTLETDSTYVASRAGGNSEITEEYFPFGQAFALFIERCVLDVEILLEAVEGFAGGPIIESEIASRAVEVANQFGSAIVGALAEQLSPGAVGAVNTLRRRRWPRA